MLKLRGAFWMVLALAVTLVSCRQPTSAELKDPEKALILGALMDAKAGDKEGFRARLAPAKRESLDAVTFERIHSFFESELEKFDKWALVKVPSDTTLLLPEKETLTVNLYLLFPDEGEAPVAAFAIGRHEKAQKVQYHIHDLMPVPEGVDPTPLLQVVPFDSEEEAEEAAEEAGETESFDEDAIPSMSDTRV